MVNLKVKIGKLALKNSVMVASGTFGTEYEELTDINSLGALTLKTITLKPRAGNPPPRLVETASGMLNSIGLENKGLEDLIKNKLPKLNKVKVPVIVSIAGETENEFEALAKRLSGINKVSALELNLSCPNIRSVKVSRYQSVKEVMIAQDEKATYDAVKAVRRATNLTVIAKLSPNVTDITRIAKAAQEAGADAVSMINTFIGLAIDINTRAPKLGNITGGLSGPAIKPIALRMVWETFNAVKIPIIGIGGIMDYSDALEFIICGAAAVQIGTSNFVNPETAVEVARGIEKFLKKSGINDIKDLMGSLKTK